MLCEGFTKAVRAKETYARLILNSSSFGSALFTKILSGKAKVDLAKTFIDYVKSKNLMTLEILNKSITDFLEFSQAGGRLDHNKFLTNIKKASSTFDPENEELPKIINRECNTRIKEFCHQAQQLIEARTDTETEEAYSPLLDKPDDNEARAIQRTMEITLDQINTLVNWEFKLLQEQNCKSPESLSQVQITNFIDHLNFDNTSIVSLEREGALEADIAGLDLGLHEEAHEWIGEVSKQFEHNSLILHSLKKHASKLIKLSHPGTTELTTNLCGTMYEVDPDYAEAYFLKTLEANQSSLELDPKLRRTLVKDYLANSKRLVTLVNQEIQDPNKKAQLLLDILDEAHRNKPKKHPPSEALEQISSPKLSRLMTFKGIEVETLIDKLKEAQQDDNLQYDEFDVIELLTYQFNFPGEKHDKVSYARQKLTQFFLDNTETYAYHPQLGKRSKAFLDYIRKPQQC